MKRTILYFFLISFQISISQTEKGRFLLSGSAGFSVQKDDMLDTAGNVTSDLLTGNINFYGRGGYFVHDNLATGLSVSFYNEQSTSEPSIFKKGNSTRQINSQKNVGLFARLYSPPRTIKFSFFAQADVTYLTARNETISQSNTGGVSSTMKGYSEMKGFSAVLVPGFVLFLNDLVALEASFGRFGFVSQTGDYVANERLISKSKFSRMDLNFSPSSIMVGINFYLGKSNSEKGKNDQH